MIRVSHLRHHYGVRPVLTDIDLEIATGELVTIVGPNGMGKSTLLGVLAGVLWPMKGYVEIDGMRWRASEETELALRRLVVWLPDNQWLPTTRTGREYLLAVGRLYDVEWDRLFDHCDKLFRLFELERQADQPISSYSNGQQKKLAICSALVTEAPVLLMDEPFGGGLDPAGILALREVLKRLAERRDVTAVITSPVPELIEEISSRVAVLKEGRLVAYDTPTGLRAATGGTPTLTAALEQLIFPDAAAHVREYFGGEEAS